MAEMTEGQLAYQGLQIEPITEREQVDPRVTQRFFSYEVEVGEPFHPDETKYPEWTLTFFTLKNQELKPQIDACVFEVGANASTPVGLVGESQSAKDNRVNLAPEFIEWIIGGSGTLEFETPGQERKTIEVGINKPVRIRYGRETKVRYTAGPDGLVGVNVGIPAGIDESTIDNF